MSVTFVTPTWHRPMQLARCMLSVAAQQRPVEHVIVSDGPDTEFERNVTEYARQLSVHYPGYTAVTECLSEHDPDSWWGRRAKLRGVELASYELINCLDDDDIVFPHHSRLLTHALRDPRVGFVFSRLWIGYLPPYHYAHQENQAHAGPHYPDMQSIHTGAQFMFRKELLKLASWDRSDAPEWPMVQRWIASGVRWEFVDSVTCQMYQHEDYTRDGYPPGRCN